MVLVVFWALFSGGAWAHPVAYQGSTAIMTWNQPFMSDSWVSYSFRPDFAVAGRLIRMDMPEGELRYNGLQLSSLLKRWNGDDFQANVYLYGGGGVTHWQQSKGGAYLGGFEADAESRKHFVLLKAEYMRSSLSTEFAHLEGRLRIAPYEAEYNEMASWFMVQTQWHPSLDRQLVVTPLARLFYKSFLIESGVSLDGEWMMNFMFHL